MWQDSETTLLLWTLTTFYSIRVPAVLTLQSLRAIIVNCCNLDVAATYHSEQPIQSLLIADRVREMASVEMSLSALLIHEVRT